MTENAPVVAARKSRAGAGSTVPLAAMERSTASIAMSTSNDEMKNPMNGFTSRRDAAYTAWIGEQHDGDWPQPVHLGDRAARDRARRREVDDQRRQQKEARERRERDEGARQLAHLHDAAR